MHNEPNSRLPGEGQPAAHNPEVLNADALARRRALIKGLGKGGAAVAAVAPIQSFAVPKIASTGQVCSLSGLQSAVSSHAASHPTNCQGWPPAHFESKGLPFDWPADVGGNNAGASLTFNAIFGGSDTRLVLAILNSTSPAVTATPDAGDLDKAYWIAAYFNAQIASNNFVYTATQVVQQYNLPYTRTTPPAAPGALNYLDFYKTYLSSRP